jgi:energy-converting hydrogenase Eha subunit C
MKEYYKNAIDEYKKISSDIGNKIITISLTLIGAIYVVSEKYGVEISLIISLLGFVFTITVNLANNVCKSIHYQYFLEGKINKVDLRKSKWGIGAECLFWFFIGLFVISTVFFIAALIQLIIIKISV